jgi:hypothetical protein
MPRRVSIGKVCRRALRSPLVAPATAATAYSSGDPILEIINQGASRSRQDREKLIGRESSRLSRIRGCTM